MKCKVGSPVLKVSLSRLCRPCKNANEKKQPSQFCERFFWVHIDGDRIAGRIVFGSIFFIGAEYEQKFDFEYTSWRINGDAQLIQGIC